jgi:3-methyladenine DNA glycosylase Mpg
MAMGITLADNLVDLEGDRIFLEDRGLTLGPVAWSSRIGIRVGTDRAWRAYVQGHPAVSGTRSSSTGVLVR